MKYLVILIAMGFATLVEAEGCFTKTGVQGNCTIFQECPHFQNITEDNSTLAEEHGGCAKTNETLFCCPVNKVSDPPVIVEPREWNTSPEVILLIFSAVRRGDLTVLEHYLEEGVDVNIAWTNGDTVLYHAAINNQLPIVEALLGKGADPNLPGSKGTPLHAAAGGGDAAIVDALIAGGADIHAKDKLFGSTPLQVAALSGHLPVVETLLKAGADVNFANDNGSTALHYASINGDLSIVEALIAAGADVNAIDEIGETALIIAKENGHQCVIDALVKAGVNENVGV